MGNNPRLQFSLSLALAAAGGLIWIVAVIALPGPTDPQATLVEKLVFGAGIVALAAGLMLAVPSGLKLHAQRKLERGETVLAQWRIGPGDLARFRDADAARAALYPSLRNWLAFPTDVPAAGLPIRIGRAGMLIGGEMHGLGTSSGTPTIGSLCEAALIEGQPAMLELTLGKTALSDPFASSSTDPALRRPFWVMRVPVPAGARADAEQVVSALDAAILRIDRDWARLTYAAHFQIADRDAAGRGTALAGAASPPPPAPAPIPAEADRSPEAEAFHAIATVFGIDAARAPTKDTPAYRKAQAQFFGGLAGLGLVFGGGAAMRYDRNLEAAMMIIGGALFVVALGFTLRGGYHYLIKRGE